MANTITINDDSFKQEVLDAEKPGSSISGPPGAARARWSPRSWRRSPVNTATSSRSPSSTSTRIRAAARDFQVMSIPTMILFQGGKPVKTIVGAKGKAALLKDLADVL